MIHSGNTNAKIRYARAILFFRHCQVLKEINFKADTLNCHIIISRTNKLKQGKS